MNEIGTSIVQIVTLLVAVAGGITLPFVLFILADMRTRLRSLEAMVALNSAHTATHAAQLAYISDSFKREKNHER